MDKKKLKVVLEVLNNISIKYLDTAQYIEENMRKTCKKEKLLAEE